MRCEISYMSSPERSDLKNWAMLPACLGMLGCAVSCVKVEGYVLAAVAPRGAPKSTGLRPTGGSRAVCSWSS